MIRLEDLSSNEKFYPFVKATAKAEYANGTMGEVANGVFTAGEGMKAIMVLEKGDDRHTADFKVKKDEDIRVCDLTMVKDHVVDITAEHLPETFRKDDVLVANASGKLVVDAVATTGLKVIEETRYGARALVVVGA